METKVSTVIQSHLNSISVEFDTDQELSLKRLAFVKLLVFKFPNTNDRISDEQLDELWATL
jgi:hypothetical protein